MCFISLRYCTSFVTKKNRNLKIQFCFHIVISVASSVPNTLYKNCWYEMKLAAGYKIVSLDHDHEPYDTHVAV